MADREDKGKLNTLDATLLVAGGILGIGIFFNPHAVAQRVHAEWAFLALWGLSRVVVLAVVVLQFLWVLIRSETNAQLTVFGQSLATYTYQIVLYLTFSTEERPFPFADWPTGPPA